MSEHLPLQLEIGDAAFSFESPDDFAFALAGRTAIPSDKLAELLSREDKDLRKELNDIKRLEERFGGLVSRALDDTTELGPHLDDIELPLLSKDHDWRKITESIRRLDVRHEAYKRIAMVRYVQYLASRQEVIRLILADRAQRRQTVTHGERFAPNSQTQYLDPKQTDVFDLGVPAGDSEGDFARLPKRETIEVQLEKGHSVGVRLGKQLFSLVFSDKLYLRDEQGKDVPLHPGRHIVGRDTGSHVSLKHADRTISRQHLILEISQQGTIKFTDISSLGTFLPKNCLKLT